ncbi:IQ domain-containing protein C [Tiliqua scincoides]|uniref:IQ domain-containing protein C n=1 Tax=Tiliqua scincoides TaxID=71010 RepID=UPI0034622D64
MGGSVEGEALRGLLRRVVLLQANVKGHLVRKRFQRLKEEYESIVKEVEGSLDLLQWNACFIPRPVFSPKSFQKPVKVKELGPLEAGSGKNHIQQKEEALSCPVELQPEMQLPSQLPVEVRQNPDHPVDKPSAWPLSEESEEGQDCSNISSVWSSAVLEVESPGPRQDLRFQRGREMPQTVPDLQRYRKHLTMELLWLQQAIASRKNYLVLKQRLGNPE